MACTRNKDLFLVLGYGTNLRDSSIGSLDALDRGAKLSFTTVNDHQVGVLPCVIITGIISIATTSNTSGSGVDLRSTSKVCTAKSTLEYLLQAGIIISIFYSLQIKLPVQMLSRPPVDEDDP